jgi:uncharacterized membrane protein SpoIIM required for sporulation
MEFDDATSAATRVLRRRPTDVLPAFLAESALTIVVQLTLLAAGGLSLVALRGTEELDRVSAAVGELGPGATEADVEALLDAVADLFTPTVLGIVAVAGLVALALAILVRSAAGAAKVYTAWAAVTDGDPPTAAVAGTAADTWTFVRLTLLQVALFFGLPVAAIALGVLVGGGGGTLLILAAVLLWIPLAIATYFLLLFVPEAIVVEGVGVLGGIRHSLAALRAEPGRALLYAVLELAALFVAGGVGGAFGALGVGRITGLVTLFVVFPLLGLVKMGLYVDPRRHPEVAGPSANHATRRDDGAGGRFGGGPSLGDAGWEPDADDPGDGGADDRDPGPEPGGIPRAGPVAAATPPVRGRSYREDLRAVFSTGFAELRAFAAERRGLVALSLAAFLVGVGGGYQVAVSTGVDLVSGVPTNAGFGLFPIDTAVNLSANNWQVSIGQTYAGLLFGLPALGNLVFNGVIVGALAGVGFDPVVFAALVVPHGVIEVPALALSGALGVHLGGQALAYLRGRTDAEAAGDELERAFLALLGLLPLFVVAGLIEAFLTPWIGDVVAGAL